MGPGFDCLRILLAASILCWHSWFVVYGNNALEHRAVTWLPGYAILVMFFGLSGFLITASALRLSVKDFVINRALRIVPALAVDVIVWALVLGPIFSKATWRQYYADPFTYKYFTNIVGVINFYLPGVFAFNPEHAVNYSLWTVPFEIGCYALMACLMVFGLLRKPRFALGLAIGFGLASLVALDLKLEWDFSSTISDLLFLDRGSRLFAAFLAGVVAYLYRHRIPYSRKLLGASMAACLFVDLFRPADWLSLPVLNSILVLPLVYVTLYLGVTKVTTPSFLRRGDYSYGVYLYAFPVQQAVYVLVPFKNILVQMAISLAAVLIFAMVSWHLVERPILALRRHFSFVARVRLSGSAGRA
jgi:peptidoglycan/LPS O-acetylase OafA/YrhL